MHLTFTLQMALLVATLALASPRSHQGAGGAANPTAAHPSAIIGKKSHKKQPNPRIQKANSVQLDQPDPSQGAGNGSDSAVPIDQPLPTHHAGAAHSEQPGPSPSRVVPPEPTAPANPATGSGGGAAPTEVASAA